MAAVLTAASLGHPYLLATLEREEFVPTRMPILAGETVRFTGEPVAPGTGNAAAVKQNVERLSSRHSAMNGVSSGQSSSTSPIATRPIWCNGIGIIVLG